MIFVSLAFVKLCKELISTHVYALTPSQFSGTAVCLKFKVLFNVRKLYVFHFLFDPEYTHTHTQ